VRLLPAWIQTSLRIRAVWSGSILFAISFSTCNRVCKRTAWILIRQLGGACWSQTHYVGFVMTRLIYQQMSREQYQLMQFQVWFTVGLKILRL
jgi:hypothetical protein